MIVVNLSCLDALDTVDRYSARWEGRARDARVTSDAGEVLYG
jgi:hypothetical protein